MAPGEVEALDISRALKLELNDQLLSALPQIMLLVDRISSANESMSRVVEGIRLLSAWLGQGVTLSKLFEEHNGTFNCLWKGLQSGNEDCVIHCCTLLKDVVAINEFPCTAVRVTALMEIVRMFTTSQPALAPFFARDKTSDNSAHEICSCIVSLVCNETAALCAVGTCDSDFWSLLLSCVSQKPRKIASMTFDAWLSLQDIPVAERHPFLQKQVFATLLISLLSQCQYPDGFTKWDESDDDEEDFLSFRDYRQGIQEVLVVCFYSLQGDFFLCLADSLQTSTSWCCLEAVMCVMNSVMESAKKLVTICPPGDTPVLLITQVASRILTLNFSNAPYQIFETACKYLCSITFFIVQSPPPGGSLASSSTSSSTSDLFFPSLEFLFNIYTANKSSHCDVNAAESLDRAAAKAIHQLCIKGSSHFRVAIARERLNGLIEITAQILSSKSNASHANISSSETEAFSSVLLLLEAAVRTITVSQIDAESANNLIKVLGLPIVQGMQTELDSAVPSKTKVSSLLSAATQIIKFSEQSGINQVEILSEFLTVLWPLVELIPRHGTLGAAVEVTNALFVMYGSCMLSAKVLVQSRALDMAMSVVAYLQVSMSPSLFNTTMTRDRDNSPYSPSSHSSNSNSSSSNSNSKALQCAGSLVEAFGGRTDGSHMLAPLLQQVTDIICTALDYDMQHIKDRIASSTSTSSSPSVTVSPARRFTDEETTEKYFSYVYLNFLVCPALFPAMAPTLQQIIRMLCMTLSLYTERDSLRAALQVIQSFFSPSATTVTMLGQSYDIVLESLCLRGEEIINRVVRCMCGEVQSSLVPNLVDCLVCILSGCEDTVHQAKTRAWMFAALSDQSITSLQLLSPADKQLVLTSLFRLISSNKRRCKALMHDFSKICSSEVTSDCLLAYEE